MGGRAVFVPAGQTATLTANLTPTAAPSAVVQGILDVVSNTSVVNQTQLIGAFPYTYTVGPAGP